MDIVVIILFCAFIIAGAGTLTSALATRHHFGYQRAEVHPAVQPKRNEINGELMSLLERTYQTPLGASIQDNRRFTAADIRSMPMPQYAEFRNRLTAAQRDAARQLVESVRMNPTVTKPAPPPCGYCTPLRRRCGCKR